jgi:hypothetical protein
MLGEFSLSFFFDLFYSALLADVLEVLVVRLLDTIVIVTRNAQYKLSSWRKQYWSNGIELVCQQAIEPGIGRTSVPHWQHFLCSEMCSGTYWSLQTEARWEAFLVPSSCLSRDGRGLSVGGTMCIDTWRVWTYLRDCDGRRERNLALWLGFASSLLSVVLIFSHYNAIRAHYYQRSGSRDGSH